MKRLPAAYLVFISMMTAALAASGRQPAPAGSFEGAPAQYTQFSAVELSRGFLALAFGSDLRIGAKPLGIRRFDHPIRVRVIGGGTVDRRTAMSRVIGQYAHAVPDLHLSETPTDSADIELRLIDERDFRSALQAAFGSKIARTFVTRTDPQCMTSVKSTAEGKIVHSISFIIVDRGDDVFLDCAFHELLHAFGLSNHDQRNPWTTLNQKRMVGYLTVYDRSLLTLLYDAQIKPGMTLRQARSVLPQIIADLGLAGAQQGH
ncbi:MAG TPA: DUF2927 domain-containing protein [Pseudolabrys sp.]